MNSFGIDFGTTNSAIAVLNNGEPEVIRVDQPPIEWEQFGYDKVFPSVFGYGENAEALFGWEAKLAITENKIEAVKRLFATEEKVVIGEEEFLVEEVATMLFAKMKRNVAEESALELDSAVVTIPANSRGRARQRTKICAGMAGIQVKTLINEPTAAAMAATRRNREDQTIFVVDWGGGTFDVTALNAVEGTFIESSSSGAQRCGGVDFDSVIMKWIADSSPKSDTWTPIERAVLRIEAEKAKILLSSQDEVNIDLPDGEVRRLTRGEFEQLSKSVLDHARGPIQRCLNDLSASGIRIDSLVLAGGTCSIPACRTLIEELVQKPAVSGINPLTAIAEGAAIAAGILNKELDYGYFVTTEHDLGTVVATPTQSLEFGVIIPRNMNLPASSTEIYSPVVDNQESLNFKVIEGDANQPLSAEDNVVLAETTISIPNPAPMDEVSFSVSYTYDENGILVFGVTDNRDESQLHAGEIALGVQKDREKMVKIAQKTTKTLDENKVQKETLTDGGDSELNSEITTLLLNARTKVAPFVDDEEATIIRELCQKVEDSSGNDQDSVVKLNEIIDKYFYLF